MKCGCLESGRMTLSELHLAFKHLEEDLSLELKNQQSTNSSFENSVKERIKNWPAGLSQRLLDELFGLGPLQSLITDENLSEILILAHDNIVVEKNTRLEKYEDHFLSEWTYRNFVQRLFVLAQARTDLNHAAADASWNGFRLHLIQKPLVTGEYQISFRRHPKTKWNFEILCNKNFMTELQAQSLRRILDAKKNLLVVGPTGAGKTTLLKALLNEVSRDERCVILEDTQELEAPNDFSTHLLARHISSSELRDYSLGDLLKQSLRMRPDRIVVGEVRGGEAKDLLLALSSGHHGSLGSLHASSVQEALFRLEFLIQMGAPQWSLESIRRLIFLSLQTLVVVEKNPSGRRLEGIYNLASLEPSGFLIEKII